ncbi:hypothetical protein [Aeromicrobium sp. Leaf350]|uniref:hypothetical protein n=1 Tax=Aeromicrobium sp. Leaf350 TaxID=2876565 RepID=UPI001E38F406|nr:hypothetical protein [Aeromicrobium sp. Leaf350]
MTAAGQRQGPSLRPSTRDLLAASATAQLAGASCAGREIEWADGERSWTSARSASTALAAAAPLVDICEGCPVIAACATWAELDHYTGIAGGRPYVRGFPRPYAWVHRRESEIELVSTSAGMPDIDIDDLAVERAVGGEPPEQLSLAERAEVIRRMNAQGATDSIIGARVGLTARAVQKIRQNMGLAAVPGVGGRRSS